MYSLNSIHNFDSIEFLGGLDDKSVDFCYIDPPFMTQKTQSGRKGSFDDYFDSVGKYADWVAKNIYCLISKLKDTGSFMIHIDPRTSHYVKVAVDELDVPFINEVVWCYNSGGAGKRNLAKKHDTILWFGRTKNYKFNVVREPYPHKYSGAAFNPEGRMLNDWWPIGFIGTASSERTGYPTQKPITLMSRIVSVATDEDDLIVDFMCGSGTTGLAVKTLNRNFILNDRNPEAVKVAKARLGIEK